MHTRPFRPLLALAAAATLLAGCSSGTDTGTKTDDAKTTTTTAAPKLPSGMSGPIEGGEYDIPYLAMPEGLAEKYGYTDDEYFLEGSAESYAATGPLGTDGEWDAEPSGESADFTTRLIVRQPTDPKKFNGTVLVEWFNVTAGRDSDPEFGYLADLLMSEGYGYVGISAQQVGVEPGGLGIEIPNVPKEALAPLKDWDPERYGDLSHPGDAYSYDIYTEAARAALDGPLGGLDIEHVIAAGESQSASRMVTYVNAVQPLTDAFDGFVIHSRTGNPSSLGDDPATQPPNGAHIRDDIDTPVLQFQNETDLEMLDFVAARQDDTDLLRTWELAGSAHVDASTLDYGISAGRRWTDVEVDLAGTCGSVNEGPQQQVLQAAFSALSTWVSDGTAMPASPRIETDADGVIVRDDLGIAIGGIRTPPVDAPTAVLNGTNPTDSVICQLFGSTTPFTDAQLQALYPDHDTYVAEVTESADQAVDDGFLLPTAADQMITDAKAADIPPA